MRTDNHEKYILYADDDTDDQEIMRNMFATIDPALEVITVENGLKVLEFLRSLPEKSIYPCFIVLDVNMPQFDGIQTLQKLKTEKNLQKIPVVMFSTSSMRKDVDISMKSGAQDFIIKPIHLEELTRVTARFSDYCHDLPIQTRPLNS